MGRTYDELSVDLFKALCCTTYRRPILVTYVLDLHIMRRVARVKDDRSIRLLQYIRDAPCKHWKTAHLLQSGCTHYSVIQSKEVSPRFAREKIDWGLALASAHHLETK